MNPEKAWNHDAFPLCPAPTDGWKQKHDDTYYRNAVEKQREK